MLNENLFNKYNAELKNAKTPEERDRINRSIYLMEFAGTNWSTAQYDERLVARMARDIIFNYAFVK